jgi:ABC-type antimicrobial peptide transport system permease subunit
MGTMSINVLERTREIGLRAIGVRPRDHQIVMVEGVGLISWAIGTILGFRSGTG